jgi:hypothetical protein
VFHGSSKGRKNRPFFFSLWYQLVQVKVVVKGYHIVLFGSAYSTEVMAGRYARYQPEQLQDKTLKAWDKILRKNLISDFMESKEPPPKEENQLATPKARRRKDSVTTVLHNLTLKSSEQKMKKLVEDACINSLVKRGLQLEAEEMLEKFRNQRLGIEPTKIRVKTPSLPMIVAPTDISTVRKRLRVRRFSKICEDEINNTLQASSTATADELILGAVVNATSIGKQTRQGVITEDNGDNTFYITYDDGTVDRMVQRHHVAVVGSTQKSVMILGKEQKIDMNDIAQTQSTIACYQREHAKAVKLRDIHAAQTLYPYEAQQAMGLGQAGMKQDPTPWIRHFMKTQAKQRLHKEHLKLMADGIKELRSETSLENG